MVIDNDKFTNLCVRFKITAQELYFLILVSTRDYANMRAYVKGVNGFPTDMIDGLTGKGLLLNYNKDDATDNDGDKLYDPTKIYTIPDFDAALETEGAIGDLENAYDELLAVYPFEFSVPGEDKKYNARTGRAEVNGFNYRKYLKRNVILHKEILEITKYGKEHNLIRVGIEKYIDGRMWDAIRQQMQENRGHSNTSGLI